jgi:glycosyltransferase involved in cell wall biosynthesis
MYARPGHPRNCYELAVSALRRLKESMGERVRIVTAGSWSSGDTEPWLDQLGFLEYRQTADLYRRCDAGLVLSVSKHPTYIPLQLMACGALVVANDNPANGWLLRDEENALLADPTPDALAATLGRGLVDRELRARLTKQAAVDIAERHSDWDSQIDRIYAFMCDPRRPAAGSSG